MKLRIKELMEARGWTPGYLARKIGTTVTAIEPILNGTQQPHLDMLTRCAEALNVPVWELMTDITMLRQKAKADSKNGCLVKVTCPCCGKSLHIRMTVNELNSSDYE